MRSSKESEEGLADEGFSGYFGNPMSWASNIEEISDYLDNRNVEIDNRWGAPLNIQKYDPLDRLYFDKGHLKLYRYHTSEV